MSDCSQNPSCRTERTDTAETDETVASQAMIFKALGHPARLKVVRALRNGERCVCELQPVTGGSLSTLSRHLDVLRSAGVIASRKEGLNIYCSLKLPSIGTLLDCLDARCTLSKDA